MSTQTPATPQPAAVGTPPTPTRITWSQWFDLYFLNKYTFMIYGLVAGIVLTSLGSEKLGSPIKPFAHSSIVLMTIFLLFSLAGATLASAHYLRGEARQTISGDTYFKLVGISLILSALSLGVITEFGRENFIALLGFLGTALGFVVGRTATDDKASNKNAKNDRNAGGETPGGN